MEPGCVAGLRRLPRTSTGPPDFGSPPVFGAFSGLRHLARTSAPPPAEGHSSRQIAELLVISVKTAERHRANLLRKLGLKDRLELTRYAIHVGLIEP